MTMIMNEIFIKVKRSVILTYPSKYLHLPRSKGGPNPFMISYYGTEAK